jgi:hypothetical protein
MSTDMQAARFTAWTAIAGACFAYLNVALVLAATGGDTEMIFHGASMLSLPAESRDLFRWGMFADVLGFYLPVVVIAIYLRHAFRDRAGALGDMAAVAMVLYAALGIAGASLQMAALHPLAHLHAGGDEAVKAAAEAAWTAVANGSQKGLWWAEGPVVLFWGLVVGKQLAQAGWNKPTLVLLKIAGWCFGGFFVFGMFPELGGLMQIMLVVVVLLFPFWMLLFGWQLLRRSI